MLEGPEGTCERAALVTGPPSASTGDRGRRRRELSTLAGHGWVKGGCTRRRTTVPVPVSVECGGPSSQARPVRCSGFRHKGRWGQREVHPVDRLVSRGGWQRRITAMVCKWIRSCWCARGRLQAPQPGDRGCTPPRTTQRSLLRAALRGPRA